MSRRRGYQRRALALSLAAGLLLAACARAGGTGGPSGEPAPPEARAAGGLWGTAWKLVELDGAPPLERTEPTLEFPEPRRAVGHASCNRFFGPVEIDGDAIAFGPLASTRIACREPVASQEAAYLGALERAERFALEGDALAIHVRGAERPLRFTRASR